MKAHFMIWRISTRPSSLLLARGAKFTSRPHQQTFFGFTFSLSFECLCVCRVKKLCARKWGLKIKQVVSRTQNRIRAEKNDGVCLQRIVGTGSQSVSRRLSAPGSSYSAEKTIKMEMYRAGLRNTFFALRCAGGRAVPTLNNAASTASQLVLMYGCRRKGVKALKTYHHRRAAAHASLHQRSSRSLGLCIKNYYLPGKTNSASSARNFITPGNSKAPFYCQSRF